MKRYKRFMHLKLFRSTGYSSILAPGETRFALHPLWSILAISLWVGIACNMPLWRALAGGGEGLGRSVLMGIIAAGSAGAVLSLFGWRRTIRPAAVAVLAVAAWAAAGWIQTGVPMLVPPIDLLHWKAASLFALLVLPPAIWLWWRPLRKLPGPSQLAANFAGAVAGIVAAGGTFLLMRLL